MIKSIFRVFDRLHHILSLGGLGIIAVFFISEVTTYEPIESALITIVALAFIALVRQVFWRA